MMKAVVQRRYGSYDTLTLEEIPVPSPGPGEVLIKVAAAGVDPGVWHVMAGLPKVARLALGVRAPRVTTPGRDVAGTVVRGGSTLAEGDQVFGTATVSGAFAEFAVAKEKFLVPRPPGITPASAAATPTSGGTAVQALKAARLTRGQRLLVIGAGGGVGSFTVQLAASRGVEVTGVCSAGKALLVRSLGAAATIDYRREGIGSGYDAIVDTAGLRSLGELRPALNPRGRLVMIGGEDDGQWFGGGVSRSFRAALMSPFVRQKMPWLIAMDSRDVFLELAAHLADGTLTPAVDRTFTLAEAPTALRLLMEGDAAGKFVLTP